MTKYELRDSDTERAFEMGKRHAEVEQELDVLFPSEPMVEEEDIRSLAWTVTGQKLDPESPEAATLAAHYAEGYWEVWDND